jgi:hypothetical protein
MGKEKVLDIKITKINDTYSLAKVKKMNRKVIEEKKEYEFGYANSSSLKMNNIVRLEPNFYSYISDAILCSDLYLNSENDCFTIKNNLVESLEIFLQEFNEKYGIIKRWRAEKEKEYFFVTGTSEITTDEEYYNEADDARYELGNYFKTKEEAQKIIDSKEWQEFWAKVRAGEIE